MDRLADLLGQTQIADELARRLSHVGARVLLSGPSGWGKTSVADAVAERLSPLGKVVRLAGDAAQPGTRFLAAQRALAGTRPRRSLREGMSTIVAAPARMVPVAGGFLAELIRIAISVQGRAKPEFLTAEQQDLLQGFQDLAGDMRAFLVVDDVGWMDIETAQLLLALEMSEVRHAYPFAATVSILFIENTGARPSLPRDLYAKLLPADRIDCPPMPLAVFADVLASFGIGRHLPGPLLGRLFAISGGHLEICKQIVKLDSGEDLASLLTRGDASTLMAELLRLRLGGTGGPTSLQRLLAVAACAGSRFSEAELRCAFLDPEAFPTALAAAYDEEFLSSDGETLGFEHEAVRLASEALASPDAPDLHGRLAACVKCLRPGDYPARLRHVRLSSDATELEEVAFTVAMQAVRGERLHPALAPDEIGKLAGMFQDAREAYRLMDAGEHRRAVDLMMPHYNGTDGLAQGEVVSLIALNRIKERTADAYNEAASILEHWQERRREPELWQRLMSILLTAWAFAGESERASQLYTLLSRDLLEASKADPSARVRLEALNRKADMFLVSEIATKHIRRAADWFAPEAEGALPRHGFEYTSCLVNLAGALFTCGRFQEAAAQAETALRCTRQMHEAALRTAEPYKALNNYVISAYRAGAGSALELGDALGCLLGTADTLRRDRTLVASNRAALALLAGQEAEALALLEAVWAHVESDELDAYYTLYVGANLAAARAVAGMRDAGLELLDQIGPHVDHMPKRFRQAHGRRHRLVREVIAAGGALTPAYLDGYPAHVRKPDGNTDVWLSIGRGLLLSDIQVWSEG